MKYAFNQVPIIVITLHEICPDRAGMTHERKGKPWPRWEIMRELEFLGRVEDHKDNEDASVEKPHFCLVDILDLI